MKKLFSYLIGLGGKAAPPSQKRAIPAHEFALKQASARRRDDAPKVPVVGKSAANSGLPAVTGRAEQADDRVVRPDGVEVQLPVPQKLRKRRKWRGEVAGVAVRTGTHTKNDQLADIALGVGTGRARRKSKGLADADVDAKLARKTRRRRPE